MKMRIKDGKPLNLNDQLNAINKGLLPTQRNNTGPSKDKKHLSLDGFVKQFPTPSAKEKIWATPTANDAKNTLTESQAGRGTLTAHLVESGDSGNGQLNPDWVEALMGYPTGWTNTEAEVPMEANFPASWLDGTWEDGIPRVASGVKSRIDRLRGLGNAIVPQCAELIFSLSAFDRWRML